MEQEYWKANDDDDDDDVGSIRKVGIESDR
jgi:hypothetical protein